MSVRLIINADDFGYFPGVSAGIIEAIEAGIVTATGVMANGPGFEATAALLRALPQADVGVHLNATYGAALTPGFPPISGTQALAAALVSGRLKVASVANEWRAQILRCSEAGLPLRFINSHEHVHMLPVLYPVMRQLAREFAVPFVRHTRPEWGLRYGWSGFARSLVMGAFFLMSPAQTRTPKMLGLGPSGRLDLAYLGRLLPRLRSGETFELMCHPGREDPSALRDPKLRGYHDWKGELQCLLSPEFRGLLAANSITLTRFRDLD
jgi:predicted glycoside hydrolase/deacetylase ChbG (UPF0249 family)